ncbi:MAG: Na+/H+ antiporter NhaA [Alphaproteobacteria bacterium]|nr:Na+/H+ antiporter NhaA [Alphaproteobacteria bacterium]
MEQQQQKKLEQDVGVYYAPWEKSADRIITPFEKFVHHESSSAFVLAAATIIALILANSAFYGLYTEITHIKLGFSIGTISLYKSMHHWVNDGLMALFFFVIGLELKREILIGELSTMKKAALPIFAGIGGMLVPAAIFYIININGPGINGWAIPMATDIAFAIGLMVLLGNRIPRSLMAFLVALAIADDLGAVTVIALFYTENLNISALLLSAFFVLVLLIFNRSGLRNPIPYFIVAIGLWFAMLESGVHATLAGVIGAMTIPCRQKLDTSLFEVKAEELLKKFKSSRNAEKNISKNFVMRSIIYELEDKIKEVMTPLHRLEHLWHVPVAFIVIPIFAFFNAGVPMETDAINQETSHVFFGIVAGLVLGKLIGIVGFSWLAIKLKLAQLPTNTQFTHIIGTALLAGIGFTMSIFIAQLAFGKEEELLQAAKMGIIAASVLAGSIGYSILWVLGKNKRYKSSSERDNCDA